MGWGRDGGMRWGRGRWIRGICFGVGMEMGLHGLGGLAGWIWDLDGAWAGWGRGAMEGRWRVGVVWQQ